MKEIRENKSLKTKTVGKSNDCHTKDCEPSCAIFEASLLAMMEYHHCFEKLYWVSLSSVSLFNKFSFSSVEFLSLLQIATVKPLHKISDI